MNNQEINNKLEQLEEDLNLLKESMSISEENISLLMIIANKDEKIKQLKRELSIQKTLNDGTFAPHQTMDTRTGNEIYEDIKNHMQPYDVGDYYTNPDGTMRTHRDYPINEIYSTPKNPIETCPFLYPIITFPPNPPNPSSPSDRAISTMKKYGTW